MPISSTGNRQRGITLMEMMVVLAIISLIVGLSFPSTIAGLENIRLASAARSVAAFMNVAQNRAERREQPVEFTVFVRENTMTMRSSEVGFEKKLDFPQGVTIRTVWPVPEVPTDEPRRFLFVPGGVPPAVGIELVNRRGTRRIVRLNPITGAPEIERSPDTP